MINVTTEFKDLIYAPSRQTLAKVAFQLVDTTASKDAVATVTSESMISQKNQIYNTNTDLYAKFASFENNYWKLDGSFHLPPKNIVGLETGWSSNILSNANRAFSTAQVLTIDFDQDHSSIGLTITFDKLANEYATNFVIVAKNSVGTTISTTTVTNNILTTYILESNLANYRQIIITFTKTNNPYRRLRVAEVSFGIIEEYTGSELIDLNVLEEVDTVSEQATANEVVFTIDNQDKRFNILNPTGIYPFLQRRQKLIPYIGLVKVDLSEEYVKMGVYYLSEWKSNEGALTATFTGRDILDLLAQDEIAETSYVAKTLHFIATDILTTAGLTTEDYTLDIALLSITVTATLPQSTYREALQLVAIAGQCVLYSDRLGKIQMKRLSGVSTYETIDFDNTYQSPSITLDKLVNTIIVVVGAGEYTYTDPAKPTNEEVFAIKIDNPLIDNNTLALAVATWVLVEKKKRFLYEINWRGNPALESSDILTVEDDFSEDKEMIITKNDYSFAGYFACKTYGKG